MEHAVTPETTEYRLLYAQPSPELGDRVCIGVLFREHGRRVTVVFDPSFPKLRCVAPNVDMDLLRYLVTDLAAAVEDDGRDLDLKLTRYTPHLSTSSARAVASPLTDETKRLLLHRFTYSGPPDALRGLIAAGYGGPASVSLRDETREKIATFTEQLSEPLHFQVIKNARPLEIFGRSTRRRIEPVAAAVRRLDGVILVDGIDLTLVSARRGLGLANKVAHTFWQYAKLRDEELEAFRIQRVGVVLNGRMHRSKAEAATFQDAHDYVLDQFRKEADLAIDGALAADRSKLLSFLGS
jgi:hypothetical protein